ncbi:hypothetical protein BSZ39_01915 [Bowdeniella nasicola]|uniref:(d)CMP kinase n=1 Tax=Bowdeniella nasicola TaxID=208480 RepID=A0A1Q5Q4V1_9ACTO|nr:AAA family ATPase [Bowdeniella nasicola]OKL54857.1 hypothetical protein BSZ39_01915 [Bowdeniella nasicola]
MTRPHPPRAIIAVDGATGAGKTTLATALARQLGGVVLSLDSLCHGWVDLSGGVARGGALAAEFKASGELRYRPYDWVNARVSETPIQARGHVLIVDGCGAASDEFVAAAGGPIWDAVVFAQASTREREARIAARDDYDWSEHRGPWQAQHDALSYAASLDVPSVIVG